MLPLLLLLKPAETAIRDGLLCFMRDASGLADTLQLPIHLLAHLRLRQHACDGLLPPCGQGWVARTVRASVSGSTRPDSPSGDDTSSGSSLRAGEPDFFGIDHDHVIAGIDIRRVHRLVLCPSAPARLCWPRGPKLRRRRRSHAAPARSPWGEGNCGFHKDRPSLCSACPKRAGEFFASSRVADKGRGVSNAERVPGRRPTALVSAQRRRNRR